MTFRSNFLPVFSTLPLALALGSLAFVACDDEGDSSGAGGEGGAAAEPTGSAVAVLSRACTPEDCLSYLKVYESLDAIRAEGTLDRTTALEVSYSQGRVFNGSIYLFSRGEQPTVTRYSVEADLSVTERETVSFANTGTTVFCEICNVFGSQDLAFHIDATAGVLVSWNPTTMLLEEISEVPETITNRLPGGYADVLFPRVFDGRAFYNAGWSNYEIPEVLEEAGIVAFDVSDPTPELELLTDERCGGTWAMAPFADEEGNVYAMGDWNAGYYQIGVLDPVSAPACLLRIRPGAHEFDPDYYVNLLEVLDARAVRNAFAMAGGKLLVSILPSDAEAPSADDIEADPWAFYSLANFRFVILDVETLAVTPVEGLGDVAAGSATALSVDGVPLLQIYEGDSADIWEVSASGVATKVINAGLNADFDMIGRVR